MKSHQYSSPIHGMRYVVWGVLRQRQTWEWIGMGSSAFLLRSGENRQPHVSSLGGNTSVVVWRESVCSAYYTPGRRTDANSARRPQRRKNTQHSPPLLKLL